MKPSADCRLLIAISGGADSVYLARTLAAERGAKQLTLAHFEHDLQADGADAVAVARATADALGCDFITEKWATPQINEAAARTARYAFLRRAASRCNARWVVTGHHADDQTETILLNFLRGCGMNGLAGMQEFDTRRRLWRPLLSVSRAEIERSCAEHAWQFYTDPSNSDTYYARNWLRHELLPQIATRYPHFAERLRNAASDWRNIIDADNEQAAMFLRTKHDIGGIDRFAFIVLKPQMQHAVLRQLFAPHSLTRKQSAAVRDFIATSESGKQYEICNQTVQVFSQVFTVDEI